MIFIVDDVSVVVFFNYNISGSTCHSKRSSTTILFDNKVFVCMLFFVVPFSIEVSICILFYNGYSCSSCSW